MDSVIIPNKPELDRKIAAIKKDGIKSIHVVSDFDRTLTKAYFKGEKITAIINHLRMGNYLSKGYAKKAKILQDKYHPIEVSRTINQTEKNKSMKEWWSNHYKLLVESGLNEKIMEKAVKDILHQGTITLRDGAANFLRSLYKNNIPMIIMSSSGIGNMVTDFLNIQKLMFDNIYFIGNTLEFDKDGKFIGIEDNKIIHVFNKSEVEIKNLPLYDSLKERSNIILLGDSISDLGMIKGSNFKNLIKIGFLNYPEESLEEFKKAFDIIITNDGSFEPINELFGKLLGNTQ